MTQSVTEDAGKNRITVLVGGCFDILHYGHITFLKQAKALGDRLVVALESDENVRKAKGDSRPIHTQEHRKEMLESLSFVDDVVALPPMKSDAEYFSLVSRIKPQVLAVTRGDPLTQTKQKQAESVGARLIILDKTFTPSTSQLAKLIGLE